MNVKVTCYNSEYDAEIVGIINEDVLSEEAWVERPWTLRDFRKLWVGWPSFKPDNLGLALFNDRVLGIAYIRYELRPPWISIYLHKRLPQYHIRVCTSLLKWVKYSLRRKGYSGAIVFPLRWEFGFLHRILSRTIWGVKSEKYGLLMKLSDCNVSEYMGSHVEENYIEGWEGREEDIAKIYNEAFKEFSWFTELSVEEVVQWLSSPRFRDEKVIVVYVNNEPAGFIAYLTFTGGDGRPTGLVDLLAVRPKFQGRGYGKRLLLKGLERLKQKTDRIILYVDGDNVKAINLYLKYGFRPYRRTIRIETTLDRLPG